MWKALALPALKQSPSVFHRREVDVEVETEREETAVTSCCRSGAGDADFASFLSFLIVVDTPQLTSWLEVFDLDGLSGVSAMDVKS